MRPEDVDGMVAGSGVVGVSGQDPAEAFTNSSSSSAINHPKNLNPELWKFFGWDAWSMELR